MLEWNVYVGDFNSREIQVHNIFDHWSLCGDLGAELRRLDRKKELTEEEKKESFKAALHRDLKYYYWSKCEWEVVIQHWPPSERFRALKIDVYDQVMLNWDKFFEYTWEHRKELKKKQK